MRWVILLKSHKETCEKNTSKYPHSMEEETVVKELRCPAATELAHVGTRLNLAPHTLSLAYNAHQVNVSVRPD